jgi:hypothetical protein
MSTYQTEGLSKYQQQAQLEADAQNKKTLQSSNFDFHTGVASVRPTRHRQMAKPLDTLTAAHDLQSTLYRFIFPTKRDAKCIGPVLEPFSR